MKLTVLVTAACAAAFVAAPARAGSLTVRDADGSQWTVTEDPADDAEDYVLKRQLPDRKPDLRYGRDGQTAFTLGADNDSPTSLRVDSTRRVWAVGATLSGNQPQPVVMRFNADGSIDTRWGVQGRLQGGPVGMPVRPNDLLPLADGSVLVAGESPAPQGPRAVVYHLLADGRIDPAFGRNGTWQRPGPESGTAAGLTVGPDGTIVVGISVHGPKPQTEVWALNALPPALVGRENPDDAPDEDDIRTQWLGNHWALVATGGPTQIVPAATLAPHAPSQQPAAAPAASTDSTGQGGFNPFASEAPASAQAAAHEAEDTSSVPWLWIGVAVALALGVVGVLFTRGSKPQPPMRHNARR